VSENALAWRPVLDEPSLIAPAVAALLSRFLSTVQNANQVQVAAIDAELSDTTEFCAAYGVTMAEAANCVVVTGKREGQPRYAACVVPASHRADVNGVVRQMLDVRKASFAAMPDAVALTGMEYGGITPIGLPDSWRIFVAPEVVAAGPVVIGSGVRRSKIRIDGRLLAELPGAEEVPDLARPVL
jgi:prolyl-tRNA editing enzyme YbaK/EbsC (Cys-tRNA(Pro) deacylase)